MKKRVLSLVLCLSMLCSLFAVAPVSASAEEGYEEPYEDPYDPDEPYNPDEPDPYDPDEPWPIENYFIVDSIEANQNDPGDPGTVSLFIYYSSLSGMSGMSTDTLHVCRVNEGESWSPYSYNGEEIYSTMVDGWTSYVECSDSGLAPGEYTYVAYFDWDCDSYQECSITIDSLAVDYIEVSKNEPGTISFSIYYSSLYGMSVVSADTLHVFRVNEGESWDPWSGNGEEIYSTMVELWPSCVKCSDSGLAPGEYTYVAYFDRNCDNYQECSVTVEGISTEDYFIVDSIQASQNEPGTVSLSIYYSSLYGMSTDTLHVWRVNEGEPWSPYSYNGEEIYSTMVEGWTSCVECSDSPQTPGEYTYVAYFDRNYDNYQECHVTIEGISKDEEAPEIEQVTPVAPANLSETCNTIQVSVSDNENLSSVTVYYTVNNGDLVELETVSGLSVSNWDGTFTLPVADWADGDVIVVSVSAEDEAGNSSGPWTGTYTVDKAAPTISNVQAVFDEEENAVNLTWTGGQEEDFDGYTVYRDNKQIATLEVKDGADYTYKDEDIGNDAVAYTYRIEAQDSVGNKSTAKISVTIPDRVAPEIELVTPATPANLSETCNTIQVSASDNGKLDSVTVHYTVNGGESVKLKTVSGLSVSKWNGTFTLPVANWKDGDEIAVSVSTEDEAGNSSDTWTGTYTVDKTAPTISNAQAVFDEEENAVKLTWIGGQEADLKNYTVYRDGEWVATPKVADGADYICTDKGIGKSAATCTYRIEAQDKWGNKSTAEVSVTLPDRVEAIAKISCDKTVLVNREYTLNGANSSIEGSNITSYQWKIDGEVAGTGKTLSYTFPTAGKVVISLTVSDGTHTGETTETITVLGAEDVGFVHVKVVCGEEALAGATVLFDKGGVSEAKAKTDENGYVTFTAAPKSGYRVDAMMSGDYNHGKATISLVEKGKTTEVTVSLEKKPILSLTETKFESLTAQEAKEHGVDLTDPANQNAVKVTTTLSYGVNTYEDIVLYPSEEPTVIDLGDDGDLLAWTAGKSGKSIVTVQIPANVTTLKDFFTATLTFQNNEETALTDNSFTLNFPEGLSLPDLFGKEQSATVKKARIEKGAECSVDWTLRGDKVGTYDNLTVDYVGIDEFFNEQIQKTFDLDETYTVNGMKGLSFQLEIPEKLDHGTLYYNMKLSNDGEKSIDFPPTKTTDSAKIIEYYKQDGTMEVVTTQPETLYPGESILTRYVCADKVKEKENKVIVDEDGNLLELDLNGYVSSLLASWTQVSADYGMEVKDPAVKPLSYFVNAARNLNVDDQNKLTAYNGLDAVLVIPEGIVMIGKNAIQNNSALETLKLPADIELEDGSVVDCSNLTSVIVAKGTTSINENAFQGCAEKLKFYINNEDAIREYCENHGLNYEIIREQSIVLSQSPAIQGNTDLTVEELTADIISNTAVSDFTDTGLEEATGEVGSHITLSLTNVAVDEDGNITGVTIQVNPVDAEGNPIDNDSITAPVKFRIPISKTTTADTVAVSHNGDLLGLYEVQGEGENRYVEVQTTSFSAFSYELPELAFKGDITCNASLTLKENINVNFYVKELKAGTTPSQYSVKATFNGIETEYALKDYWNAETGKAKVTVASAAASEMTEPVAFEIYFTENGNTAKVYEGTYSVQTYCDSAIAYYKDSTKAKDQALLALCQATLDYGACAQKYFNKETVAEKLANCGNDSIDLSSIEIPEDCKATCGTLCEGISSLTASLVLKSATTLKVYCALNGEYDISDYTFTYEGNSLQPVLENKKNNKYSVKIEGIGSSDLSSFYEVVVTNTKTGKTCTIRYSPLSYAYQVQSLKDESSVSEDLLNLVRSLYNYSQTADAYFAD